MATETKNPPVHKIKVGSVQASIWEQTPEKGDPFYTVTFKRSYKTELDGPWKTSHSFGLKHLDDLADATIDAKDWVRQHRQSSAKAAA